MNSKKRYLPQTLITFKNKTRKIHFKTTNEWQDTQGKTKRKAQRLHNKNLLPEFMNDKWKRQTVIYSKGNTVGSEIRTNAIQLNKVLLSRKLIAASLTESLAEI